MKKKIFMITAVATLVFIMTACGTAQAPTNEPTKAVGAPTTDAPAVSPTEDDEPSGSGEEDGTLVGNGFDHIKVPCLDDFNDRGINYDTRDSGFELGEMPEEWAKAWQASYQDFLVANGSTIDSDGTPAKTSNAVRDGNYLGFQYLYYGDNPGEVINAWGDINLFPNGMYPGQKMDFDSEVMYTEYVDAYFFEIDGFVYGKIDEALENEYRAASTMMLSWIVPNPSEVEKVIYDAFVDDDSILWKHYDANGCLSEGNTSWLQVGDVDICVWGLYPNKEIYAFCIREHK